MSDQRTDDETIGRALGRAIETQSVRETPYSASRLAARLDRPARGGWLGTLAVAAALGLFVAMGAFFATRGQPGGVAAPDTSPSPSTSATSGPGPTSTPPAVPTSNATVRVYFARDGLPPVGGEVAVSMPTGAGAAQRITARLTALLDARQNDVPAGATTVVALSAAQRTQVQPAFTTTVAGDLATVELVAAQRWPISGAAMEQAFVQQLVYTATEEPGIRRVQFTGRGGTPLQPMDQLTLGKPLSREDVFGYDAKSPEISHLGNAAADVVDWRASVDDVTPGLGRFVVELRRTGQSPPFSVPAFIAKMEAARNANDQEPGKYVLRLELPDVSWVQTSGEAFKCCQVKAVNKTPIRQISAYPLGTGNGRPGVGFGIDLDDARPWRVFMMESPLRVVVDIGGHPDAVSADIAVYAPRPGAEVARTFTVSGASRTYESTVHWRLRDSSNHVVVEGFTTSFAGSGPQWGTYQFSVTAPAAVSGNVTLEVLWGSPRDGSDMGLVAIPLRVR